MHDFQDAFISYGRVDSKDFAIKLQQRLLEQGIKVWFDQNDIPLAVDYQNQIDDGIAKTDNFVFIISPHSVNSPYCLKEIELALRYNKRIIPVLHVEQISQEVWQTRNLQGDTVAWETYQAKGLHTSFANIHPDIAKINWVFCREGVDDFEDSLPKLIALFERHQDYVKKHTYFLVRALEWQQQRQQFHYLPTEEECRVAEDWLKTTFKDEQSPCFPTDLHCEYITESIKNANNLMTQVFLCYAEEDRKVFEQIRRSLIREAFTVWTNKTDIQAAATFQEVIDHGIEEADNIVYLISSHSLRSSYCQHEIEYALSLNKRIIPILIERAEPSQLPAALQGLQFINLADNLTEADYSQDENQLIRTLRYNAIYFEQHKLLLTKALKWERQNRNPSLLLRGYNLQSAEAWLRVAKLNINYLPTALQREFIQMSSQIPPGRSLDVFISYSAVDADFARRLNDALQNQGKSTWFDQENIASDVDSQQEVFQGVEMSNNFVFVLSPSSVNSSSCIEEIQYARKLNKRIVTILYHTTPTIDPPPGLVGTSSIDFNRHNGDFLINFGNLVRILDTDQYHVQQHTRLLVRSLEWQKEGQDPGFLLRGKELIDAREWLKLGENKQPQPTDLQRQYIRISYYAPLRKPKLLIAMLTSLGMGFLVITARFMGWLQPLELAVYDQFMRSKPNEARDDRLLLVAIDDTDIKTQNKLHPVGVRGSSLPEPSLTLLLDKLQQAQPRVIALDMYRDFNTDQPGLIRHFQQDQNFIVTCELSTGQQEGTNPPPELSPGQFDQRLGFSDLTFDKPGDVVRRQLLVDTPTPPFCPTDRSFSLMIARQYLESQGKSYREPFTPDGTLVQTLKLGDTPFPRLYPYSGGYQGINTSGYQILLNFRFYQGKANHFLERVSLRDVLADKAPSAKIRDRIVIVGFTSRNSVNDYSLTAVGELPGVVIQAQMVSQLISAVLDGRPLIWWLPFWGDCLWILGWAMAGGAIVWAIQRPRLLIIVGAGLTGVLCLVCYEMFVLNGVWLPLVPSAIIFVTAARMTVAATHWIRRPRGNKDG
ncbi:TIR domain-containing protein (plasmid) [Kovacikia minuta CCNUW1]|uniref:TIR domain-containing protein n=1 Tax=Kovacikia minuta TaxID=2931930 RepID=UPI001CCFCEDA|nr:TIR domain-containing protein [Kovacikia minuta]UBF30745.1 TIR domain-containing protein [Kovacikia minuta CCNUW1]